MNILRSLKKCLTTSDIAIRILITLSIAFVTIILFSAISCYKFTRFYSCYRNFFLSRGFFLQFKYQFLMWIGWKRLYYLSEYALVYANLHLFSLRIKILLPLAGFSITLCHYMLHMHCISAYCHKERFFYSFLGQVRQLPTMLATRAIS